MKYPMIAYLDKDGVEIKQLTGKSDADLFDRDESGKVIGCTRAMAKALKNAKIDNLPIAIHTPGKSAGLAVAECDDIHG